MPVQRFRTIEEMARAPQLTRSDEACGRFLRLCARMRLLSGRRYPRGVFRFHSIEEAQAARVAAGRPRAPASPPR
jgi:hypothetical protein